ncbi:MAG: hypothetical protein AB1571_02230 [Nanoarchaeota archaeon]
MKRFLLLFILLNISSVAAQMQIEVPRSSYMQGETVQAALNFSYRPQNEITLKDIGVYTMQGAKVSLAIYFLKLSDTYYYAYFELPYIKPGNYSLNVGKYFYIKDGLFIEGSNFTTFNINEAKGNVVALDPAFIKLDTRDYFSFKAKNNGNTIVNISITSSSGLVSNGSFLLEPGSSKVINVSFVNLNKSSSVDISYGNSSYTIPVYAQITEETVVNQTTTNFSVSIPRDAIRLIEPVDFINLTLGRNDSVDGPLRFRNFFNEAIDNLDFSLSSEFADVVKINISHVTTIEPGETIIQYLWINNNKNLGKDYKGKLVLSSKYTSIEVPIYINYREAAINKTTKLIENVTKTTNLTNVSITTPEKKSRNWVYVLIFLFILIALTLAIFLFRKKPKQESFEELISSLKR